MRVIIKDNKLVIITDPKIIHFDLRKHVNNNVKHETEFITNEFLAEHIIKNKVSTLLSQKA